MEQPTIRSYRIRGTRITAPQQSALDKYWGIYGIDYSLTPISPSQLFPNSKEVILEIHSLWCASHLRAGDLI